MGLGLGHTVALLRNNRHEWAEAQSACTSIGTTTVPVNWHFSVDEVAYILENSSATAVIADAEFADTARAAAERACIAVRVAFGGPIDGFADYDELLASSSADEPEGLLAGSTMFYTSGTTGDRKACALLRSRRVVTCVRASIAWSC